MKSNSPLLDKISRKDGLTVPDGFFADFERRMADSLPERPELEQPRFDVPRTLWQRVRPYVYMAAMFGGVWCMIKMFSLMGATDHSLSIDSHPSLATAVGDEQFVEDFVIDDISDYDIYDSMLADSIDIDGLQDSLFAIDGEEADAQMAADGADAPILPQ